MKQHGVGLIDGWDAFPFLTLMTFAPFFLSLLMFFSIQRLCFFLNTHAEGEGG
jgi:hypothetical protein